ncbi:GIY-YIG nuclease family protein [Azorhizobium doebereinerae]|uniref:GIY-YIG nuclease family protein n=1 Tax=Azorhizobium doebereinerae TaxID=281091 RepID=UPI00041C0BF0|nr:GIY-YIG nuclease family protein [Azorhizobium doebereinerae]
MTAPSASLSEPEAGAPDAAPAPKARGPKAPVPWSAYILECGDGTLYCGVAVDVSRRMQDHATPKGSRYVRGHGGVARLLWSAELPSRTVAQRVEYHLKRASRAQKLAIMERAELPAAWLAGAAPRRPGSV